MSRRHLTALLAAAALLPFLVGCSAPAVPQPEPTGKTPAAVIDFDGEWVLTRAVTASDDPALVVGDETVRYALYAVGECGPSECEGTVTSGADLSDREESTYIQTGDTLNYSLEGTQDCVYDDGSIALAEALIWTQHITIVASELDGSTVTAVTGESTYSFQSTPDAEAAGCPVQSGSVSFSYEGVRG